MLEDNIFNRGTFNKQLSTATINEGDIVSTTGGNKTTGNKDN